MRSISILWNLSYLQSEKSRVKIHKKISRVEYFLTSRVCRLRLALYVHILKAHGQNQLTNWLSSLNLKTLLKRSLIGTTMENFDIGKMNTSIPNLKSLKTLKSIMGAAIRNRPSLPVQIEAEEIQGKKPDWLTDGGEIAEIIKARDWSKSALGPIENWPQSLRTTVSLCLASNFPINILWGPDAIQIYNTGYKELCGKAHPRAIGESYRATWESAWPAFGEPFEKALRGETSYLENQRMFLTRNGYLEETFFTFSLSPIRDESGNVAGIFHPVTETTSTMLNQRRTRLLRDLSSESENCDNVQQAASRIMKSLVDYTYDIPGAIIVLKDESGNFKVSASTPNLNSLKDLSKWPLKDANQTAQPHYVNDMIPRFGNITCSDYPEPIERACLLPFHASGEHSLEGYLIVLISPRLPFDESYMAFFDLLNFTVNTALANAVLNEETKSELSEFKTDINELKIQRDIQDKKEKELLEAKFAAEAATRSKSAFLANMSHEIRTPLTAILGFTEILKTNNLDNREQEKYLNIISRNGDALVRIIDDILDLSKIEAGKIHFEQAPLCLTNLVEDVVSMFSDQAKAKGLRLEFSSKNFPQFKVESDAVRIRQILVNLVGNAIKFTSEGSVRISGEYKPIRNNFYEVTLYIADTGIGISKEQAAKLFQAFNQADNSTTRNFGGTGLGLALSKKLAKAMGGNVSIADSRNAKGSTFIVKLNVKKSLNIVDPVIAELQQQSVKKEKRLNGWKILVVDDSIDNRYLLKMFLEREGAISHEAPDAITGCRMALESDYDVVLMDIQMPEVDGYEALAMLRKENYKKPIYALTAHTLKEEKDRALAAGFTGHIGKPINSAILVDTLKSRTRHLH